MHPNPCFAWTDQAGMDAFVAQASFAHICVAVDGAPLLAHAPLSAGPGGSVRFHLAHTNALIPHLDGAAVVAGVVGDSFYVSPDWYRSEGQVPTWNYRLVEIAGTARRLDEAELIEQLERLSEAQEALLAPKPIWRVEKLGAARLSALLKAIVGFSIEAPVLRGTAKFSQNKSDEDAAGVAAALRALGNNPGARAIEEAR